MGHRARGLQRATATAWDYLPHDHARSRAYRWNEDGLAGICDRHQRDLLRPGALERPRPDPQGAALRADRHRGQSRRGRQGVLLLPRQHAHALVHAVPLQVPAGGVPLRAAGRGEPAARPRERRVRAGRHRRLRRATATSTCSSSTPRRQPTTCSSQITRRQPRARGGAAARAADDLVPQHLVVERRRDAAPHARGATAPPGTSASRSSTRRSGARWLLLRRRAGACSSPRTTRTPSGCSVRRTARATSRTASTTTS